MELLQILRQGFCNLSCFWARASICIIYSQRALKLRRNSGYSLFPFSSRLSSLYFVTSQKSEFAQITSGKWSEIKKSLQDFILIQKLIFEALPQIMATERHCFGTKPPHFLHRLNFFSANQYTTPFRAKLDFYWISLTHFQEKKSRSMPQLERQL